MAKIIKILGKGRYSVSENQQFVDRSGQLVRPIRDSEGKPRLIPVGRSYGFFDSAYSSEEIQGKISDIRVHVQIPNELELSLMEELENLNTESQLFQIAKDARDKGMNYMLEGTFPNVTDEKTAEELKAIIIPIASSYLIAYKESGKYKFKE